MTNNPKKESDNIKNPPSLIQTLDVHKKPPKRRRIISKRRIYQKSYKKFKKKILKMASKLLKLGNLYNTLAKIENRPLLIKKRHERSRRWRRRRMRMFHDDNEESDEDEEDKNEYYYLQVGEKREEINVKDLLEEFECELFIPKNEPKNDRYLYKEALKNCLSSFGIFNLRKILSDYWCINNTLSFPKNKKNIVDWIYDTLMNKVSDISKRNTEMENLDKLKNHSSFFLLCDIVIPRDIIDLIFSNIKKNKELLDSVGLLNSDFYYAVLQNWDVIHFDKRNVYIVPIICVRNIRYVSIKTLSYFRIKEIEYLQKNLKNIQYMVLDGKIDTFFRYLKKQNKTFEKVTQITLRGSTINNYSLKNMNSTVPNLKMMKFSYFKEINWNISFFKSLIYLELENYSYVNVINLNESFGKQFSGLKALIIHSGIDKEASSVIKGLSSLEKLDLRVCLHSQAENVNKQIMNGIFLSNVSDLGMFICNSENCSLSGIDKMKNLKTLKIQFGYINFWRNSSFFLGRDEEIIKESNKKKKHCICDMFIQISLCKKLEKLIIQCSDFERIKQALFENKFSIEDFSFSVEWIN